MVHHDYVFKCSWSNDVCFFWIEMFVWVQVLRSRPIADEYMGRKGEVFVSRKKEKKLLRLCTHLSTETELDN